MRLQQLLRERNVSFETMRHSPVYTSQDLAATEHVSGHCVAKPVIVQGSSGFAMCVLPASSRLDLPRVAGILGDKGVRMATEQEMAEVCPECELGAEPPVGSLFGLKTVMDESLHDEEYLVLQDGSHTTSVKMRREDYERVASPQVAPIAVH